jgi:hypothetical protein
MAAAAAASNRSNDDCFEIRDTEDMGRDLISRISCAPDDAYMGLITPYDGHRRDPHNGSLQMRCSRITDAIDKLSVDKRNQIARLPFTKTWALSINRQRSSRVVVDGTRCCSSTILL